jgi:hypothetical protein
MPERSIVGERVQSRFFQNDGVSSNASEVSCEGWLRVQCELKSSQENML